MKFTKMEGIGNDYVYIDLVTNQFPFNVDLGTLAKNLSDRHYGIGSDGLVLIAPSKECDFKMIMFNSDGSESEMCGNATRCIGKYVFDHRLTDKTELTLGTKAGVKKLSLRVLDGKVHSVTVDMGEPILNAAKIPTTFSNTPAIDEEISALGKTYKVTCVSMGNPHACIFVDDVFFDGFEKLGAAIECDEHFPKKTNVEFIEVIDRAHLKMRVWERGAGETLACGTGACASFAAARLKGLVDNDCELMLRGGALKIEERDGHILMSGGARETFQGEFDLSDYIAERK